MTTPVLHVRGNGVPPFVFSDAYLGRGQSLIVHVDEQDGDHISIYTYTCAPDGTTDVRAEVAPARLGCGCP